MALIRGEPRGICIAIGSPHRAQAEHRERREIGYAPRMGNSQTALWQLLREAAKPLPNVREGRTKQGKCLSGNGGGGVFAYVSKKGLVIQQCEERHYAAFVRAGGKKAPGEKTRGWLIVPSELEDVRALRPWLARAQGVVPLAAYPLPKRSARQPVDAAKPTPAAKKVRKSASKRKAAREA